MAKPYRSRSRLVLDLLRAIRDEGDAYTTRLLLIANLTHSRLQGHVAEMQARGWIEPTSDAAAEDRRGWRLTAEGRRVLGGLEKVEGTMQDFGLRL
ncbi:MAG: winged helix-turn-helix domain-containing protein [Candidatus Thermoplasmatota archaeon]|jgi:predicted transcriptional regulator